MRTMKILLGFAVVWAVFLISCPTTLAATLVVDDNLKCPDAAYSSIQDAIDAAREFDTILICQGSYGGFEAHVRGIKVTAQKDVLITAKGTAESVGIYVSADDVVIEGLTLVGSCKWGIYVDGNNVQIINNTVDQTALDTDFLGIPRGMSGIECRGQDILIKQNRIVLSPYGDYQVGILARGSFEIEENRVILSRGKGYQIGIYTENGGRIARNKIQCHDNILETPKRDAQVTGIRLQLDVAVPNAVQDFSHIIEGNIVYRTDCAISVERQTALNPILENDLVIRDNVLANNGYGIRTDRFTFATISGNLMRNCWWDCIYP